MKFLNLALILLSTTTYAAFHDVDPSGEHHHFLGTVKITAPKTRRYARANVNTQMQLIYKDALGTQTRDIQPNALATATTETLSVRTLKDTPNLDAVVSYPRRNIGFTTFEVKNQGFTVAIAFQSLDVNDMLITRQDGSTYRKAGTYKVWVIEADKEGYYLFTDAQPTRTGIDVPAGFKYGIEISAVSEEGENLTDTVHVDLR